MRNPNEETKAMTSHDAFAPQASLADPSLRPVRLVAALRRAISAAIRWVREVSERGAQRRALAQLDDRLLRDIGVSRAEADMETKRVHWRR